MPVQQVLLAKALKVKNRQVQKVRELQQRINATNSYLEGSEPDFDANALYSELEREVERLWQLKAAINAANSPIQPVIYELAERKGLVTFLKSLNTQRGLQMLAYMATQPQEYVSQITARAAADKVAILEKEIDRLQDRLDEHNATTLVQIEVED